MATDSEKLDAINKEVKRIKIIHGIGVAVVLIGFIWGVDTLSTLLKKIKNK